MPRVGISLGSNLGNRLALIRQGVKELRDLSTGHFLVSSLYETAPVGCPPDSPSFYNAVAEIETDLAPAALLRITRSIEETHGRPAERHGNAPRPLDLDLLYYEELVLDDDELILPHPRMKERSFVMIPLAEIRPEFAEAARDLERDGIRRLPEPALPGVSTIESGEVTKEGPE